MAPVTPRAGATVVPGPPHPGALHDRVPRRRGTPAQRAIAAQAIRSIRRTTPTSGLRCLHHAADYLARSAAVRLDAGFTGEATDTAAAYVLVEAIATHVRADRWNQIVR